MLKKKKKNACGREAARWRLTSDSGPPPLVPRGEPLQNSLCLPFPGGYYLTSAYGALSLIKNFQEEQAARLLSSEARDTLRQWHKRRTTNRTVPSVDDFQVRGRRPGWAPLLPHGPHGSGPPSSDHPVEKGYFKPSSDLVSLLSFP